MSTAADPMPVPAPHRPEALSPRGREILCAVRHVFAEKGFERASMQDLARAAGMSVGNFYRYFPSKAAMIEALVQSDVDRTCRHFDGVLSAAEPVQALRARLRSLVLPPADAARDDRRIWAEISIAALRDPVYAQVIARLEHRIADNLLAVMALSAGLAGAEAAERFRPHAELVLLLVKASIFELPPTSLSFPTPSTRAPHGAPSPLKALLLRQLDLLLTEIADARPKEIPPCR